MLTGIRLKEHVTPFARRLTAASHPLRLAILHVLCSGDMRTGDIASNVDIPENLAVHHLMNLTATGWVTKNRLGKTVTYHLNDKAFFDWYRVFADTAFGREVISKKVKP